jgi:UDP-2-acetamido-3-amino-2,3-dideoxy-glucuronate N-acetyltransferase
MDLLQKSSSAIPHLIEVQRVFDGVVRLFSLENYVEQRGTLLALEFSNLTFAPRRVFVVHGVPTGAARGGHAHMRGEQLLIAIAGEVLVELRHEGLQHRISLTESTQALLIGPRVWSRQTYATPNAVLMVHASEAYDEDSYLDEESNPIERR